MPTVEELVQECAFQYVSDACTRGQEHELRAEMASGWELSERDIAKLSRAIGCKATVQHVAMFWAMVNRELDALERARTNQE